MALTVESTTALQMCKVDIKSQRVPYAINWRNITTTTNPEITRTPTGPASYAMSPREAMSEMEDTTRQKVGMREDKEKKTYEPYTSRERCYEQQCQYVKRLRRAGAHNESVQLHPLIADQKPYITGDPKPTCSAAEGNSGVSV